jgi:hypothetical protein
MAGDVVQWLLVVFDIEEYTREQVKSTRREIGRNEGSWRV